MAVSEWGWSFQSLFAISRGRPMNEHDGLQEMTGSAPTSSVDDPQGDAVTDERFRRVMASFATGVTVITTQLRGELRGMTANAFMSGSLEPPLCVVSVGLKARMHAFLLEAGHFGVNILARGQESLIGHFSGRPVDEHEPEIRIRRRHAAVGRCARDDRRQSGRAPLVAATIRCSSATSSRCGSPIAPLRSCCMSADWPCSSICTSKHRPRSWISGEGSDFC